ncbi:InlB B-repeat-containing protein [Robinsoniella sp. KNHs210]|uniref:InlB B-repeat-containing protein n=1 Tax=Robinsoniella sp. KNHs210 TaxID=1469950 RepID=UPI00047FE9F2|nr:hypothetical protein [Robinsoniella sp. KNHs210]
MKKKKNSRIDIRRILAYLLTVCICIGGIPIAYALGDEKNTDNKTLLTYNNTRTEVDVFEPTKEFEDEWQRGYEKSAEQLGKEGYEKLEAAYEKDVMIYVSKEETVDHYGRYLKMGIAETNNMEEKGLEKYDGSGGSYYVWRLYIGTKSENTPGDKGQPDNSEQEQIQKEVMEYFWLRTDIPVELQIWDKQVTALEMSNVETEENTKAAETEIEEVTTENVEEPVTEGIETETATVTDSKTDVEVNSEEKSQSNLSDALSVESVTIKIEPGIAGDSITESATYYNTWQQAGTALHGVKAPDTVFRVTFLSDTTVDVGNTAYGLNSISKNNCAGLIFTGDKNETETLAMSEEGGKFSLSSDGYGHNTNLTDDNADPSVNQFKGLAPENAATVTFTGTVTKMDTAFTIRNAKLKLQNYMYGNGNRLQIGPGLERTEKNHWYLYGGTYNEKQVYDRASLTVYGGEWYVAGTTAYNQKTTGEQRLRIYGGTFDIIHGPSENGNQSSELDLKIEIRKGYGEFKCGLLEPLRGGNSTADKVNVAIYADPGVIGKIDNYYSYTSATGLVPKGYKTVIDAPDFTFGNVSAGNAYVVKGTYTMPCELIINNVKAIGRIAGVGTGGETSATDIVGRESTTDFYPYKADDSDYGIVIRINCDVEISSIVYYTKLIIGNGATVNKIGWNYINPNKFSDFNNVNGVYFTKDLSGDVDIIEGGSFNVVGYQYETGVRNIGSSDNTGTLRVNPLAYTGIYVKGDYLGGLTLDVVDEAVSGLKKGQKITRFLTSSYADVKRFQEKGMKLGPNLRKNNYGIAVTKSGTDGYYVLGDKMDYQVSYSANGATGSIPLANSYEEGKEVTVVDAAAMIPPADKAFDYWESSAAVTVNGTSTTKLNPNDTFVMPAQDITLKAIWKDAKTDITFDGFEDGNDALLKIKNEAGKVNSKALPKIKINGADAALEDLEKMTYTYERYTRTGSSGNYTYGWSGKVLQEGINDADIEKLPVSITKPGADNLTISANTKKTMSGIVKLTISYNGDENSQASCIIISSGDVDLNGNIRASDIVMLEAYISGDPGVKLDQYAYQKIMGDMNSEATTGTIRITPQDVELLEAIIVN